MQLINKNSNAFPLKNSPLIHCITNTVTCETVANGILYIGGKPIMTEDIREFSDMYPQVGGLLINIGNISEEKEQSMISAIREAKEHHVPFVVDNVGVSSSGIRKDVAMTLLSHHPTIIKGNVSEMRGLCDLKSHGKGVDASEKDQDLQAMNELKDSLLLLSKEFPKTCFLATGPTDLIVYQSQVVKLNNGISVLDQFTGTGDVVGALITTLLGSGVEVLQSVIQAVSYFNISGEKALEIVKDEDKIASIREELLNQLSLLKKHTNWQNDIKGEYLC